MALMEKPKVTVKQFLLMTPAERTTMPLQESSTLWAEIMARDLKKLNRLFRSGGKRAARP